MNRLSILVVGVIAAGCSAQISEEPVGAESSEVRIARCPASFSLAFSNVQASAIPTEASVGGSASTLTERQRAELAAIQAKFVAAGSFDVQAQLSSARDGVCRYRQPSSSLPNETIKLYSKGGKDILEMTVDIVHRPFVDDFRVYAFPTSYSTEGFTFGSESVLLDGVVGIPDGPNLVVKVGTATLDAPLASTLSEVKRAINTAVDSLNGPESKHTHEITLAEAPSSIAPSLKAAYKALVDDLSNDAYGDEKDLDRGVYEVFKSAQDHTVLGYAVWVHGDNGDSGRGRVRGFDLTGRQVVDAEDSWAED